MIGGQRTCVKHSLNVDAQLIMISGKLNVSIFILINIVDADEMPRLAAFHLGLQFLLKTRLPGLDLVKGSPKNLIAHSNDIQFRLTFLAYNTRGVQKIRGQMLPFPQILTEQRKTCT